MSASRSTIMTWQDVLPAAKQAFVLWPNQASLAWAKRAWSILLKAGLLSYRNEEEHCRAALTFIGLVRFYHDFSAMAWQRETDRDYYQWIGALALEPYAMGTLIADCSGTDEEIDIPRVQTILHGLAGDFLPSIIGALREGFQGEEGLFVSMWQTGDPDNGFVSDTAWHGNGSAYYLGESYTLPELPAFQWLHNLPRSDRPAS